MPPPRQFSQLNLPPALERLVTVVSARLDRATEEDFEAAGLLEGLDGKERAERLVLLRRLSLSGVGMDDLRAAVDEDRLALLPLELAMAEGGLMTAAQLSKRSGISIETVIEARHAIGLPRVDKDDAVYSSDDLEAARALQLFLEAGLTDEDLTELLRVLGRGMFGFVQTLRRVFAQTFLQAGDTEAELALRYKQAADYLGPAMAPVLVAAATSHMREQMRTEAVGAAERESGQLPDARDVAVCFADIVGFTAFGGDVAATELLEMAGRLEHLTLEIAVPPVRMIKTIGDAVMLVSPDAAALVGVAVTLAETAEADEELPSLRAGVAFGPAINRGGDWYGHTVNLASRVTGVARADTVLVTDEVREAAADAFEFSRGKTFRLRGVREPISLYRATALN